MFSGSRSGPSCIVIRVTEMCRRCDVDVAVAFLEKVFVCVFAVTFQLSGGGGFLKGCVCVCGGQVKGCQPSPALSNAVVSWS